MTAWQAALVVVLFGVLAAILLGVVGLVLAVLYYRDELKRRGQA